MKFLAVICVVALVAIAWVSGEVCVNTAAGCTGTKCAANATHAHIKCVEKHCTCSLDPLPCLTKTDCSTALCFDSQGHHTHFHCLDSNCVCIRA